MSEFVVPDTMVEAAARALHDRDCEYRDCVPEDVMGAYGEAARAALAAALGVCEVREDWGCRYLDLHAEGGLAAQDTTWWHPRGERQAVEEFADAQPWGFHARVIRRLSIITPAEPVDIEGAPT